MKQIQILSTAPKQIISHHQTKIATTTTTISMDEEAQRV
jgi:hypothetical protein